MLKVYAELTKMGIVIFVLLTGLAGYALSFAIETAFSLEHLLTLIAGLYFLSSGSLALNQVQEWDIDRKMPRTAKRPIAAGKIKPLAAGILSFFYLIVGTYLLFETTITAGVLGVLTVILYNGFYTLWWKKVWVFGAVPGALPGALPVSIGYAANDPRIWNSDSVYLFLILFLWQMPHFWTLAIRFKEDYRAGGIPVLPSILGVEKTMFQIGLYTAAYAGVALASPFFVQASWFYLLLVVPFAVKLLLEFRRFNNDQAKWFPFFMWVNVSVLVFLFVPLIDKWSFLFLPRV